MISGMCHASESRVSRAAVVELADSGEEFVGRERQGASGVDFVDHDDEGSFDSLYRFA